jgi:ABC-type uncharacterized transport system substrate-binding protein
VIKRRAFIAGLGVSLAGSSLAAQAQTVKAPKIGVLNGASADYFAQVAPAFREGLQTAGYTEGQNVSIEYRSADGRYERLPALAAELVEKSVAVIAATGGPPPAIAAKAASPTIPVVFLMGADPVKLGLVESFNHPEGHVTGVSFLLATLGPKRLEIIRDVLPKLRIVALLMNPDNPTNQSELMDVQSASDALSLELVVLKAKSDLEIEKASLSLASRRPDALLVAADAVLTYHRAQIVNLAARVAVPAIYSLREFAYAGGLMSYGTSVTDAYRQVGVYVGRILNGARTVDLPVIQPTKFDLVLNLKTAKTLSLSFPQTLLATADELIE